MLILFGRVAWAHDLANDPALNAAFESLPGASFTVNGRPIAHGGAKGSRFCDLNAGDRVRSRMFEFESCHSSHPVRQKREIPRRPNKSPPFADFSTTANSLHVPKLGKTSASSPKVSADSLNYSRFLESLTRDYFDRRMGAHMAVVNAHLHGLRCRSQETTTTSLNGIKRDFSSPAACRLPMSTGAGEQCPAA
jgi:hypothetical protein